MTGMYIYICEDNTHKLEIYNFITLIAGLVLYHADGRCYRLYSRGPCAESEQFRPDEFTKVIFLGWGWGVGGLPLVPLPLLGPTFFPIILFVSTTLLTR
jgi:hypothetical protein